MATERLLAILSSSSSSTDGGTIENKRQMSEHAKILIGCCRKLPIHKTTSSVAVGVVEQAVRHVGQELLIGDPTFRSDQHRNDQPRYIPINGQPRLLRSDHIGRE